jgi:FlaA1/EpsC-like NDP-sugar epimerase
MINDAIELVLETLVSGKSGEMYVRKSPACTIGTLAAAICEIFNHKEGYVVVGPRIGEKIHETLIPSEEESFTSKNTRRLDVEETKDLLLKLPEIQREIHGV